MSKRRFSRLWCVYLDMCGQTRRAEITGCQLLFAISRRIQHRYICCSTLTRNEQKTKRMTMERVRLTCVDIRDVLKYWVSTAVRNQTDTDQHDTFVANLSTRNEQKTKRRPSACTLRHVQAQRDVAQKYWVSTLLFVNHCRDGPTCIHLLQL